MSLIRRLALVLPIVFGGSLVLAAAAIAAGGGGGLAPGAYTFSNKSATATFGTLKGGPPGQQGFSVFVDQGLNSFRPKDPNAPRTVVNDTIVNLTVFDDLGNSTFGCFVLNNPSDFTIGRDLQTASLHTTLNAGEVCPGVGAPVAGKSGVSPLAGGGPGGGALPLPITLAISWTGVGVTTTGTDRSTSQCQDYSTVFNSNLGFSNANATGTISVIAGSFSTPLGVVSSTNTRATIKGIPQPDCFPL